MSTTTTTGAPAQDCYSTVGMLCVLCRTDNNALCGQCATGYRVNAAGTSCVQVPYSAAVLNNMYVCMMALAVIVIALFIR